MRYRPAPLLGALVFASLLGHTATAADIVPYRASYTLGLASIGTSSQVVGAGGMLLDEWDEACHAWTEQEHFYQRLEYANDAPDQSADETYSNLVTWEAKDALQFRFDMRQASTGQSYEEVKGQATLAGTGKDGTAAFMRPETMTLPLPRGTLFPAAYTRLLIERAQAGDHFISNKLFDGTDATSSTLVTAVIERRLAPGAGIDKKLTANPLLHRPSWQIRLAFFSAAKGDEEPDYEEDVQLLDNGVMQDMVFDYGDYAVHAELTQIEALPRPHC
jgi:hypothetical protein